ncbi:MAG: T9SS type A sorting domain-containing protein [Calditrichaceae bacterium]|nr:T9SS type A sorting domain-containing protein [Calditrichaceae bacterium]RQV92960.1 MAG: T9SS C-terminal target domain-containing protein [Calditrichota bacterium]
MEKYCVILINFLFLCIAQANTFYVRPDSGNYGLGNGYDWGNAFAGMPPGRADTNGTVWTSEYPHSSDLIGPGDTVYVSGGVYRTNWEPAASGTAERNIVILRATDINHGTDEGWSTDFDNQVVLDQVHINIWGPLGKPDQGWDYITIDGAVKSGIKIFGPLGADNPAINLSPGNQHESDYITLRYLEVEGPGINLELPNDSVCSSGIHEYSPGNRGAYGLVIQHCKVHNYSGALIHLSAVRDFLVENCELHDAGNNQDFNDCHVDLLITNYANGTFRYNKCYNSEAAGIAIAYTPATGPYEVYGNYFHNVENAVEIQGQDNELHVFNNTFDKCNHAISVTRDRTTGFGYNNLFYRCYATYLGTPPAFTHDYSWSSKSWFAPQGEYHSVIYPTSRPYPEVDEGPDPFINADEMDYHLNPAIDDSISPIDKGKSDIGSQYNLDLDGVERIGTWDIGAYEYDGSTGITTEKPIPDQFSLSQNFPNPFNPITNIEYQISNAEFVTLKIFDVLGREVVTLVKKTMPAGIHTAQWNGKNTAGQRVGSGIYFYRLKTANGFMRIKKMIMMK